MALTRKQGMWLAGGGLVALYLWQKYQIDQVISTGQGSENEVPLGVEGADAAMGNTATIKVRLTTYYPTVNNSIEGGPTDKIGRPLNTIDQFRAGQAEYAALSGDDAAFPYGQRVSIDAFPDVVFRVVDTGGSFSSRNWAYQLKKPLGKLYRLAGYEPIDVCSDYPEAAAAGHPTTANMTIYAGDDFASQAPRGVQSLDYSKFRNDVTGRVPQGSTGDTQVAQNDTSGDSGGDGSADEFQDPGSVA